MIEKGKITSISGNTAQITSQAGAWIADITVPARFIDGEAGRHKLKSGDWVVFVQFPDGTGVILEELI